ncbi:hypothetical protein BDW66DRAFT_143834 [Aspergillus desertorum]
MDPVTNLRAEFEGAIREIRTEIAMNCRPKPVLPDPEKFSGQALKFDTWLSAIRAKLRVDGQAIGDAIAQFYYVYLNHSSVQAMVLPQLHRAEESNTWDFNYILDQLKRVYDNPNQGL